MTTQTTLTPPGRKGRHPAANPAANGLPDPRPITAYTADYDEVAGNSRITIKLVEPCVVRHPIWQVVDCADGSRVKPNSVVVQSNVQFYFDFSGLLATTVALVEVPYQDMQVQNFQGGFVRPGGQWFRAPA